MRAVVLSGVAGVVFALALLQFGYRPTSLTVAVIAAAVLLAELVHAVRRDRGSAVRR